MAESWTGSWLVRGIGLVRMKDRATIGVRGRFPQRLVLIDHLAAVFGDLKGSVAFMRKNESRGSPSKRTGIACT